MGERFTAASRPGPGQWAAMVRALELCRTQPPACPQAPQFTRRPEAGGPGGPWGEGRDFPDPPLKALSAGRTTANLLAGRDL